MDQVYLHRNFLCIDLKSFFASAECLDRGLNPFTTPLVVANPTQGNGAITLAVTPYLKTLGVKSRGRLYEIPKSIKYMIAKPRMSLYLAKSREVVEVYLKYVSLEDLHIYSIDECFLDVTNYLKMYGKSDYELALDILEDVQKSTGLTATCGIGPNMLLAKLSMDIEAKHNKDFIAKWTYDDIPTKLWPIHPLSKVWGIGPRMEVNLNRLGIYSVYDLAHYDRNKLKQKFGVIGTELWNHANGIDLSLIGDMKKTKDKSYSHSQVLFKDYNGNNIKIIIREMVEVVTMRLHKNHVTSSLIGLGIGYSKDVGGSFYHQIKLDQPTDIESVILANALMIFDKYYEDLPIRKVTVSCGRLQEKSGVQLNIFDNIEKIKEQEQIDEAILEIKDKYGKNALLKASSLLNDSTIHERNKKIGGHSA
ncbi:MAG TPA: Y-family DNA polymerase [Candidatus Caccenecus avistercoris]|nr:Y-family DNA polymerase [Candidatus Caccenecus avistercoris]